MRFLMDIFYLLLVLVLSPWLLVRALTTGKYRRGMWRKFIGQTMIRDGDAPCAWFHGVSVGEIHLLQGVVALFRQQFPDWDCVISTTTDTGYDEACKRFADLPVFFWPLDFSWAVRRGLRLVNPSLVILAEGEIWPNFLWAAKHRGVPVAVINGRMSPRSLKRYQWARSLVARLLDGLDLIAVQTDAYAQAFRSLGARPERIHVTGSVKYDGVIQDRWNAPTVALRDLLALQASDLIWIAGSTQDPEEEMVLEIFERLRREYPRLRLFLVPRQKDRFEAVAQLLRRRGVRYLRRSSLPAGSIDPQAVVLIDSIGELGSLWGLADIAFVGGSLDGRRGGQNMIEPAAYGAAVLYGPHVWNFRDTAHRLVEAQAALQVADAQELEHAVRMLLADPAERQRLGRAAQRLVHEQQGATARTIGCLKSLISGPECQQQAA